jgi:farnesyl-diphosphate farnesyltransferase
MNEILRAVSRSFYLTIRILPAELRKPIGIAYMLARASDTIADSSDASVELRRAHLAAFAEMIGRGTAEGAERIAGDIDSPHAGEVELMRSLPAVLGAYVALETADRALVSAVLAKIIHGQDLDVARFGAQPGALGADAELEEYTYLVAGCVGEFWTTLCLQHLPNYSRLEPEELTRLGIDFGKGLQLVNILRDMPADLAQGRRYLPEARLEGGAPSLPDGLSHSAPAPTARCLPEVTAEVFRRWMGRARELLDAGRRYTISLRPARLRAACFLPWTLGVQTLDLLEKTPPTDRAGKVKVTRSDVQWALWKAMAVTFSDGPLRGRE